MTYHELFIIHVHYIVYPNQYYAIHIKHLRVFITFYKNKIYRVIICLIVPIVTLHQTHPYDAIKRIKCSVKYMDENLNTYMSKAQIVLF